MYKAYRAKTKLDKVRPTGTTNYDAELACNVKHTIVEANTDIETDYEAHTDGDIETDNGTDIDTDNDSDIVDDIDDPLNNVVIEADLDDPDDLDDEDYIALNPSQHQQILARQSQPSHHTRSKTTRALEYDYDADTDTNTSTSSSHTHTTPTKKQRTRSPRTSSPSLYGYTTSGSNK